MDLERLLDKPILRHLRTTVATVRALAFVVAVAGSAVVLLALVARYFHVQPGLAIVLAAVAVVVVTASSYAWYYVTHSYDPPFYKIHELKGTLVVEAANGHHRYRYERRQTVEATRNNLRLIEFRAHWTGQGKQAVVQSLRSEHSILDGRRPESDGRVHRWVYPRRPLARGQKLEVGISQVHEDETQEQLPYFREGGGRYRTNLVTVTVTIPLAEHMPDSVRGVIWNTNHVAQQSAEVGELTVERHVDAATGLAEYTVTFEKPQVFHSYGIEWAWSKERPD
jgi:hypothetical protein